MRDFDLAGILSNIIRFKKRFDKCHEWDYIYPSQENIFVYLKEQKRSEVKLLTKDTDYAIRALIVLGSQPGQIVSARSIAEVQDIPYEYLRKLLRKLSGQGWIETKEGGQGGVRLIVAPSRIRIIDVISVLQGQLQLSECMFRKRICPNRATCVLRQKIVKIEQTVTREFEKITIKKLLNDLKMGK